MPHIDCARVKALGQQIQDDVTPLLEEANKQIPAVSGIEQTLYTSVDISLATVYTVAVSYMDQMIQGASECFKTMNDKLKGCADSWDQTDQTICQAFDSATSG